MLDPVTVFRLCGKLHTLRKQACLVHIVILYREISKFLSLGIFDMVCFCTKKSYVYTEIVCVRKENQQDATI